MSIHILEKKKEQPRLIHLRGAVKSPEKDVVIETLFVSTKNLTLQILGIMSFRFNFPAKEMGEAQEKIKAAFFLYFSSKLDEMNTKCPNGLVYSHEGGHFSISTQEPPISNAVFCEIFPKEMRAHITRVIESAIPKGEPSNTKLVSHVNRVFGHESKNRLINEICDTLNDLMKYPARNFTVHTRGVTVVN